MSTQQRTLIIAHRGASADHPENTLEAFRGALDQGADWVELDVRLSADGCLVVHHDPNYADGRAVALTVADDRPPHVPLLPEALAACAGMGVNIEIKNSPGDLGEGVEQDMSVARLVTQLVRDRADVADPVLVTSFDEATLMDVRSLVPTGLLAWDLGSDPGAVERAAAAGDVAVHPWDAFVDAHFMERCKALGLLVNTWTVDDPARILELAALGADGIITNTPGRARELLGG
jgi:glycerophosphoryl diester phosphodiesterase